MLVAERAYASKLPFNRERCSQKSTVTFIVLPVTGLRNKKMTTTPSFAREAGSARLMALTLISSQVRLNPWGSPSDPSLFNTNMNIRLLAKIRLFVTLTVIILNRFMAASRLCMLYIFYCWCCYKIAQFSKRKFSLLICK